jgi:tight adherence protein C
VREKYREVAAQPDAGRHSAHGTAVGGAAGSPASVGVLTALDVLSRDRWLTRQVSQREQRMLEEFPTVAELLALAVTAGEGRVGALERVQRTSNGGLVLHDR